MIPFVRTLAFLVAKGEWSRFGADLVVVGPDGTRRRLEIAGLSGQILVSSSGAVAPGELASEVGSRAGPADPAKLPALCKALEKAGLDAPRPVDPKKSALRVLASGEVAQTLLDDATVKVLLPLFEAASTAAVPVATAALTLVVEAGDAWKGQIQLSAGGTDSVALLHPAEAVRRGVLTLERAGVKVPMKVEPATGVVVVAPGRPFVLPFEAAKPAGKGPVRLVWRVPGAALGARFGAVAAPEGVFASAPVDVA